MSYCTERIIVTRENQFLYNYPIGTELFNVNDWDGVFDRDTLKRKMKSGEIHLEDYKLSADGKLIRDTTYEKFNSYVKGKIRTGVYEIAYLEGYELTDLVDKETLAFMKKTGKGASDIDSIADFAMLAGMELTRDVYSYRWSDFDPDGYRLYISADINKICKSLVDSMGEMATTMSECTNGSDCEDDTLIPTGYLYNGSLSEKYARGKIDTKNILEAIDFALENCYRCNGKSVYDCRFMVYMNDNLRTTLLMNLQNKWTLEDEMKKVSGCIQAIESSKMLDFDPKTLDVKQEFTRLVADSLDLVRRRIKSKDYTGRGRMNVLSRETDREDIYVLLKSIYRIYKSNPSKIIYHEPHFISIKELGIRIHLGFNSENYYGPDDILIDAISIKS